MKIHCDCCGKFLFNSKTDSMGAAGAEAQRLGFIYKMPGVFYHTDKLSVIFCGKECCKRWFKENVSQETSEAAKPQLEAMRKRMKKAADEFPKHLDNFLGVIKHAKQEIRNGRKMVDVLNDPGMETLKKVVQETLKEKQKKNV